MKKMMMRIPTIVKKVVRRKIARIQALNVTMMILMIAKIKN
jgi:hypothetical protein